MPSRRTVVITGASAGIGAAAARRLADREDTRLILLGRNRQRTAGLAEALGAEHLIADFTELDQVRAVAEQLRARCARIDVLALNAAAIHRHRRRTVDGFDTTLQVNHLAPALLTELLEEPLHAAGAAVVVTASRAERHAKLTTPLDIHQLHSRHHWCPHHAYANSKLGNVLFARSLARHRPALRPVSFHPGIINTGLAAALPLRHRFLYRSAGIAAPLTVADGGANLVHFIDGTPGRCWQPGVHYDADRTRPRLSALAAAEDAAEAHWQLTRRMLGLTLR
ncbi:SDR family NAD(P)-dependent oxidoreductase [Nesterenkonia aerolata]|uniref:SDR family NAD(P)-dependent oxidoreductase n=1 Tax=Nesterenkonia aerolata TaxID=3074079 RepID=A0ABU2DV77_9MICC|nr:SDR family NAD(P)-dependent oxidoreductase [Nesterenkonia sp. LY-0111]MDR8020379.1 SDR family NAD(P)-dependent oxidoreductase [Nesterenkonia sp. LY-0111]